MVRRTALVLALFLAALPASAAQAAPAFQAPVPVSGPENAHEPDIGVDAAGNALAVWAAGDTFDATVRMAARPAGGSWGPPVDLATEQGFSQAEVAVGESGDAVVVWTMEDSVGVSVLRAVSATSAGELVGDVVTVSLPPDGDDATRNDGHASSPRVAMDPDGNAVAVWAATENAIASVQAADLSESGWSTPVALSEEGRGGLFPEVAMDLAGNATAVFQQYDPGPDTYLVVAADKPAGGAWEAVEEIASSQLALLTPQIGLDINGHSSSDADSEAVAGWWTDDLGGGSRAAQAAVRVAGAWEAAQTVSAEGEEAVLTVVGMDPAGNAISAWGRDDSISACRIRGTARLLTGAWVPPVNVSDVGNNACDWPAVGVVQSGPSTGNALGLWIRGTRVEGVDRLASSNPSPPVCISAAGAVNSPQLAVDSAGNGVGIWVRDGAIESSAYEEGPGTGLCPSGGDPGGNGNGGGGGGGASATGTAISQVITLADLPPPVVGKVANVEQVSGTVFVALPLSVAQKGLKFVPLQEARQIPVGSFLDTRKGTVRLQSATGSAAKTQQGTFASGLFQVLQSRKKRTKGLTDLVLKGGRFTGCGAKKGKRAQAALSRKAIRRLSGNAKGRFRTRGRYSAATVRGTKWAVTDRCDNTLTKVTRGRVAVRDFRRKKTVVVRAGKSYVAER